MIGTLYIQPTGAKLLKDTDWFGKMDPYCRVTVLKQMQQTKTHNDGGINPKWNQAMWKFKDIPADSKVTVEVYDDDTGKDEFVG